MADVTPSTRLILQPIYLRANEAAAMLAMSVSKFFELVKAGVLPQPIKIFGTGMTRWRRIEIEEAAAKQDELSDALPTQSVGDDTWSDVDAT
jgi:predicted DNA-binding transcriptional regulator AlpA